MTILSSTVPRKDYTGGGGVTLFAYTWKINDVTELAVYQSNILKTYGIDYTITGVGTAGGNVSFNVAPANGEAVAILSNVMATQQTVWTENDPNPAKNIENAVDKDVRLIQQLQEVDQRSLKFGIASLVKNVTVLDPVSGQFLRYKDATTVDSASVVPAGGLGVPISTANGGTGASYASVAALAKGLGLALWGGSAGGSATLTVTANIGQLPDPLTTNIFTVSSAIQGLTTAGAVVGQCIKIYWNAASVVATHTGSFFLMSRQNHTFTTGDMSEFTYVGSSVWIETDRYINALVTHVDQFWRGDGSWQRQAVPSFITGLLANNNAGDAVNDLDIAPGATASDDADPSAKEVMYLAASITGRLDANWAVGTNQGKLDTGAVGNNTYHVFVIKRPDTGVVDVLFSLSPTAPTMPANYTFKQRIGSIVRTGGTILGFNQEEDFFHWKSPGLDINDPTPGTTAKTGTIVVPTGLKLRALLNAVGVTGGTVGLYISSLDDTDLAPSLSGAPLANVGGGTAGTIAVQVEVSTNTSAQIRYRSGANAAIFITAIGWFDPKRGRN